MSRSVSTPPDAAIVVYTPTENDGTVDRDIAQENWGNDVSNLKRNLTNKFPSLRQANRWAGREDRVLLSNDHCEIGVSEYCGLVAVWVLPNSDNVLASSWIDRIEKSFRRIVGDTFGETLRRVATTSNGEAFFERV